MGHVTGPAIPGQRWQRAPSREAARIELNSQDHGSAAYIMRTLTSWIRRRLGIVSPSEAYIATFNTEEFLAPYIRFFDAINQHYDEDSHSV